MHNMINKYPGVTSDATNLSFLFVLIVFVLYMMIWWLNFQKWPNLLFENYMGRTNGWTNQRTDTTSFRNGFLLTKIIFIHIEQIEPKYKWPMRINKQVFIHYLCKSLNSIWISVCHRCAINFRLSTARSDLERSLWATLEVTLLQILKVH